MNARKKTDRSVLPSRIFAYTVIAAIIFLAVPVASAQVTLHHEPAEPRQLPSAIKTPHPAGIDHSIDLSSRKSTPSKLPSPQAIMPVYKTSGKEFYLMFLASIGSESSVDPSLRRIYISARSDVHGKVSLADGAWEQPFVTSAKGLVAVDLPDWAEMMSSETEVILPKVFKIEAEDEIAVYGFSHKWLSSDGFSVLPIEALGTNYTVASLRNALSYYGGEVESYIPNSINPRSEFGIAAVSDNTTVTITLTADSYTGKFKRGIPFSFTMNKGEAIQIMAHDTAQTGMFLGFLSWLGPLANGIDCDLTGSQITSDKPIAVFSGHERAAVPDSLEFVSVNHSTVSRDHLIEQMPPQENWGKHFAVVASVQDYYGLRPKTGDIIRVISASDSTSVSINGKQLYSLNKGSYTQFPVTKVAYIETSQPALVVKYLQTALPDSAAPGDPDLTVVPPLENMSTFYTIPTVAVGYDFTDHFVTILADSLALGATTLDGELLASSSFKPVPGSRYYWTTQRTAAGTQRVESPLPCYAETYGYGPFDSYSFSGGGSFKYLHDLVTKDLDFGKIIAGSIKDSLTGVQSVSVPMPLGDSITIYGYSWVSGDTNAFALLDTITNPFMMPPGYDLRVNFKFHPLTEGSFQARLHVWSSNTDDVFINVSGQAGSPKIAAIPDTIDFGKVHIGNKKDSVFRIGSVGSADLNIHDNATSYNSDLAGTPFTADSYPGPYTIVANTQFPIEGVHFQPLIRGSFQGTIFITSNAVNNSDLPVYLFGTGINYIIHSPNYLFGKVRVGDSSSFVSIPVSNIGDDTTSIVSISFVGGDVQDFELDQTTLPPVAWHLGTPPNSDSTKFYKVKFIPKLDTINPLNIVDTGFRFVIVKILTADNSIYYDTLSGIGAEPWLVATIPVLDFGTITNPLPSTPAVITLYDTLVNEGSMDGVLQSLVFSKGTEYSLHVPIASNTPIIESNRLPFAVDFKVDNIGDFRDTIFAQNDSRNQPLIILTAKVRAGITPISPVNLDTISNCLLVEDTITIYNPYRVNIQISSVHFEGDTGGFELLDTDRTLQQIVNFPIFIDGGSFFRLHIGYRFPADSLNGSQTMKVIIARPSGGDDLSINYDTVLVTLSRKTILLNLSAVMPPYPPSAGDQPFRLPLHLNGDRFGKSELDDDTLRLVFSNKLIRPIGVDRTGSLTESTPLNGVPAQPPPVWDEASSTYSIPCVGLHLSSDATKNTLLLTLLCTAYLTKDTAVTMTPVIGYTAQPCAYRVARDSALLLYANECGDQTIRSLMLTSTVPIHLNPPVPDPLTMQGSQVVTCTYFAAKDLMLSWKLSDPTGSLLAQAQEVPVRGGDGSVVISLKQIRASGAHYLEITVRDPETGSHTTVISKFTVIK